MKHYLIILLIVIQYFECKAQNKVFGKYQYNDTFTGILLQLKPNNTYFYHMEQEMTGKINLSGKFTIHKNIVHLNVNWPVNKAVSKITFQQNRDSVRTIRFVDNNDTPYTGASITLNNKITLIANINGVIPIPPNLIIKKIKVGYPDIKDSTFFIEDFGRQNIKVIIPVKSFLPIAYGSVVTDWLIIDRKLYPLKYYRKNKTYFLKRL